MRTREELNLIVRRDELERDINEAQNAMAAEVLQCEQLTKGSPEWEECEERYFIAANDRDESITELIQLERQMEKAADNKEIQG